MVQGFLSAVNIEKLRRLEPGFRILAPFRVSLFIITEPELATDKTLAETAQEKGMCIRKCVEISQDRLSSVQWS